MRKGLGGKFGVVFSFAVVVTGSELYLQTKELPKFTKINHVVLPFQIPIHTDDLPGVLGE